MEKGGTAAPSRTHGAEVEGAQATVVYNRDARQATTLACAGLGVALKEVLKPKEHLTGGTPTLSRAICVRAEVIQTPRRQRGTEEEGTHAVVGLVSGCPICADDVYASGRRGVTSRGARVKDSERCDCRGHHYEEENTACDI